MDILNLPNEIILNIADELCSHTLSVFSRTCHRLWSICSPLQISKAPNAALLHAAYIGNPKLASLALLKGADTTAEHNYMTPLRIAAREGHAQITTLLLEHHAEIDAGTAYEEPSKLTALHYAAERGHTDVAKILLDAGANPNSNHGFATPLHFAAEHNHPAVVELLLENGADIALVNQDEEMPLNRAAYSGALEAARVLLRNGADIKWVDSCYGTPLHAAADMGHVAMIEMLIEAGCPVEALNHANQTALLRAAVNRIGKGEEAVKVLLKHGADVGVVTDLGTPLHGVVSYGSVELANYFLDKGVDVNARNAFGETALHSAAYYRYRSLGPRDCAVIKLLLEKGADINAKTIYGQSVLHIATYNSQPEIVKMLLEEGADINAQCNEGWTVLHEAVSRRRSHGECGKLEAIVKILVEWGMNIYARNHQGVTAFDEARAVGWHIIFGHTLVTRTRKIMPPRNPRIPCSQH